MLPASEEFRRAAWLYEIVEGGYTGPSSNGSNNAAYVYFAPKRGAPSISWLAGIAAAGFPTSAPNVFSGPNSRTAGIYKGATSTSPDSYYYDRYALNADL